VARARASGLVCRPLAHTLHDTAEWAHTQPALPGPAPGPLRPAVGLAPEREAAVLQAWRQQRPA
jgi:2'-hydroxyisoflavone reductase